VAGGSCCFLGTSGRGARKWASQIGSTEKKTWRRGGTRGTENSLGLPTVQLGEDRRCNAGSCPYFGTRFIVRREPSNVRSVRSPQSQEESRSSYHVSPVPQQPSEGLAGDVPVIMGLPGLSYFRPHEATPVQRGLADKPAKRSEPCIERAPNANVALAIAISYRRRLSFMSRGLYDFKTC
jgi:hypothetical protein